MSEQKRKANSDFFHDKLDSQTGHLNRLRLNQLPCSIMSKSSIMRPNPFYTLHHKLLQESSFNVVKMWLQNNYNLQPLVPHPGRNHKRTDCIIQFKDWVWIHNKLCIFRCLKWNKPIRYFSIRHKTEWVTWTIFILQICPFWRLHMTKGSFYLFFFFFDQWISMMFQPVICDY